MDPKTHRFGLFRVRSPLLTKSLNCFLFLQVLRWFTSLSSLPKAYEFSSRILHFQRSGFPHSDISGSTPVCGSPKLFAAYHVLHRLPSPRHPPYALSSLIITCLWRSLCVCRVCPSIFNCQRPQLFRPNCKFGETKGRKISHKTHNIHKKEKTFCLLCLFVANSSPAMEMIGFEPTASAVQVRRSPN